jgi:hypothetical protein
MDCVKTCFLLLLTIFTFFELHQCGRLGGSRGGGGGYRAPSYRAPSYRPPSYHPTAARRPPSYHPTSAPYRPRPSPATHRPSPRPQPPAYEPPSRVATSRPVHQTGYRPATTARPGIYRPGSTHRPYAPAGTTRRTYHPAGTTPRRYTTARPSYGSYGTNWNNLPPRPGHGPVGPPRYGTHAGGYQGPQKIKIVNKYNYHYPGYYSLPVQHYSYPGYYYTPSYYHYGVHDTGSTALGFYLGYSLGKLTTPTYSHYSFYDGYRPQYDHYTVHHYYHNRESVPQNQEIRPNSIVGCVGDSTTICPVNTTSLCTSDGALMCVVSATSTVPCSDNRQVNCIKTTISCVNNTAPECKNSNQNSTSVSIPCVSSAKVYGDLTYVNNTIIVANATNVLNGTNSTATGNSTTGAATNNSIITTTPGSQPPPATNMTVSRKRRDAPQDFCVTIVALPAKRKATEGEQFLDDAKFLTGKFIESAWNL